MKITAIEATTVSIPYRIHWRNLHTELAGGAAKTQLETTVVVVRTDEGIEGIGEVPGGEGARRALDAIRPRLVGADPLAIDRRLDDVEAAVGRCPVRAGLDFALHDILGKALGVPLYQILGGMYRERIPLVWTLGIKDVTQRAAEAKQMVEQGFRHVVKLKVGVADDVEHVVAVSRAIGDVPVRPDANMGHPKDEALAMLKEMQRQGVRLEIVEDPCPTDFAAYQEIADTIGVGISVHGGCLTDEGLRSVVRHAGSGIVCANLDPFYWGIRGVIRAANALESVGIGCTMGPSHGSGIKTAVGVQLGAVLRNLSHPVDLLGPMILADDLLVEPLEMAHGDLVPPAGPGLGITLDRAAVERLSVGAVAGVG